MDVEIRPMTEACPRSGGDHSATEVTTMNLARPSATHIQRVLVLLLFSGFAYAIAPFTPGDMRVAVPRDRELDAIQQCLLVGSGMDKLQNDPASYYDTAILYPDRNQLRSTEPFLGFALMGLPLRTLLHLSDADVFEVLRWLLLLVSLTYAYLLLSAMGLGAAVSLAGAVLCVSQADVLSRIESLQILAIPLILPVFYHFLLVCRSRRLRHGVGLFFFAALYPLCGVNNGVISVIAGIFVLPLILRTLAAQQRQHWLTACLMPLLLAAVVDLLAVAPWLLDRSDLKAYESDAFLLIKHWTPMQVPGLIADIPGFVAGRIGPGLAAALAILCLVSAIRLVSAPRAGEPSQPVSTQATQRYLFLLAVAAVGVVISASHDPGGVFARAVALLYQALFYVTLLLHWRSQIVLPIAHDETGIRPYVLVSSAGLGTFLCLVSFGPLYVSNPSPLANHAVHVLLHILPPLKALREYQRIWIFGVLFVSIYATVRLGIALRLRTRITRAAAAAMIVIAAGYGVYDRPLVAATNIEAPKDFVQLASQSRARGGIYVHPYMKWNSLSGVLMIPIAKQLGRPIVNGYLGVRPPWFIYATDVLHRFPAPEAVWLLQKWKVETVVSLVGNVQTEDTASVHKVFERDSGVLYEIAARPGYFPHPSGGGCQPSDGETRTEGELSQAQRVGDGASLSIRVPPRFQTWGMEISFEPSVVDRLPISIGVYAHEDTRTPELNRNHSGEWIESLAADALLHRRSPVATIQLDRSESRTLHVSFRKSEKPPIARIVLCGDWVK